MDKEMKSEDVSEEKMEPKFDVKKFKKLLRRDVDVYKAMKNFVKCAQGPSGHKVVSAFLQDSASMDSPEIIALFAEKRPMSELVAIFKALEVIFLNIAGDLEKFGIWGMNMIKQLLDSKNIRTIYRGLSTSNTSTEIKATLTLLTSMVMTSSAAAREVASRFNFKGETLSPLFFRTNVKDVADVRLCVIRFLMSFLMTGDNTLIYQIMDQKGVLNGVFPGLPNDKVETIKTFLSALKSQIIENNSMQKTTKIRLLNDFTLGFVFKLFKWNGIPLFTKKTKKSANLTLIEREGIAALVDSQSAEIVHQLAHEFLLTVCCSYKNGIIFSDSSVGTSGRNCNHTITNILKSIDKPYENPWLEETVIQILKACPDQIVFYFQHFQEAYLPRPSVHWYNSMEFLIKVLKLQDLSRLLGMIDERVNQKVLGIILINVLTAAVFKRDVLETVVNHQDFEVRNYGLRYAQVVLKQAEMVLNSTSLSLRFNDDAELQSFRKQFTNKLYMCLPSVDSFLKCWNLVCLNLNSDGDDGMDLSDSVAIYNHLKALIDILDTYVIFKFPKAFIETENQINDLLNGVGLLQTRLNNEEFLEIQLLIFRHLADTPFAKSLLFRKVNDKTVALILCEAIGHQQMATPLLKKFLLATMLFSSVENEIDLWFNEGLQTGNVPPSVVLFLQDAIIELVTNTQVHLAATNDHILQALGSSANDEKIRFDAVFQDIMKDNLGDGAVFGATDSQSYHNSNSRYSPLVGVALQLLERQYSSDDACKEFVLSVMLDILHSMHHPSVLIYLLKQYTTSLTCDFINYLNQFTNDKVKIKILTDRKKEKKLEKCVRLCDFVRVMFEMKTTPADGIAHTRLAEFMSNSSATNKLLVIQQILTYLNLLLAREVDDESRDLISTYCGILVNMLNYDDADLIRCSQIILSHPVIQENFLHEDLLNVEMAPHSVIFWSLTKVTLQVIKKLSNYDKQDNLLIVFKKKITSFIYQLLNLLVKDLTLMDKLAIVPLVDIIEPILTSSNLETICAIFDILLRFSTDNLLSLAKTEIKLNGAGELLTLLLRFITTLIPTAIHPILDAERINLCSDKYVQLSKMKTKGKNSNIAKDSFGKVFIRLLESSPLYSSVINQAAFRFCLEDVDSETSLRVARVLLQNNFEYVHIVEDCIFNSVNSAKNLVSHAPLVISLMYGFRCTCSVQNSENYQRFLKKLMKLYWPLILLSVFEAQNEQNVSHLLSEETAANLLFLLVELDIPGVKEMLNFAERCMQQCSSHRPMTTTVLQSSQKLFSLLTSNGHLIQTVNALTAYAMLLLKSFLFLTKSSAESNIDNPECHYMIQAAFAFLDKEQLLPKLGQVIHADKCWHPFVKLTLKNGLRDENGTDMLCLLRVVMDHLKRNEELLKIHASSVFDLVLGHSHFLPGLLDVSVKNSIWRESLLDLLIFLVTIEPAVCSKTHIPIFLAAYRATLSSIDQKLLQLLFYYEKHGVDVYSYKPFIWGEPAIEQYSIMKNLTQSLWKEPSMKEVMNLFDKNKLLVTALNFPLDLELKSENHPLGKIYPLTNEQQKDMYDPRFVLLLFSNILSSESLVYCNVFIESNGLGFVFAGLGSSDENLRAIAYHLLWNFYQHLEGAKYRKKLRWICLLDCIRNSMPTQNLRLPNVITVFLVKTSQLLLNQEDSMAKPIINYLFIKPALDLWNIPEFYFLFNNPDIKLNSTYRSWILTIICEGLRTPTDYRICQTRYTFKIMLSFIKSPLASYSAKLKILQIVKASVRLYPVLMDLIQHQGILATLHAVLKNCNERILSELIAILSIAWKALVDGHEEKRLKNIFELENNSEMHIPNVITSEFLLILLTMLNHFSMKDTSLTTFGNYLSNLESVLKWTAAEGSISKITLTTSSIKQLMEIYVLIEERNFRNSISESFDKNCKHLVADSDWNECTPIFDQITTCEKKFLEILLNWNPCFVCNDIADQNIAICDGFGEVFLSFCDKILRLTSHFEADFQCVKSVYLWLYIQLINDRSNMLTHAILQPVSESNFKDIFSHLFGAYEKYLLMGSKAHTQVWSTGYDDAKKKKKIVIQLSRIFIAISQKVSTNGFVEVLENITIPYLKTFVRDLCSENVQQIIQMPAMKCLISMDTDEDENLQYEAALVVATFFIALWLKVEEQEHFVELNEKMNLTATDTFQNENKKCKKRKSFLKIGERKRRKSFM